MTNIHNPALKQAWNALAIPLAIIPVAPRSKRPLNSHGSLEPIRTWNEFKPFADRCHDLNYGILTGAANQLLVLDVDSAEGSATLEALHRQRGGLFPTFKVRTGRGFHLYYRSTRADIRCKVAWQGGVDVRCNGGYVIGPGSTHENGHLYQRADGLTFNEARPAPSWLEAALAPVERADAEQIGIRNVSRQQIVEGRRNSHLTSLAGRLHNTGAGKEAMLATLNAENEHICRPPLDAAEIAKIATSVSRYDSHLEDGDAAQALAETLLSERFAGGAHLLSASDGKFWHWVGTHWDDLPKVQLRKAALETLDGMPPGKRGNTAALLSQNEVLLQAKCFTEGDPLRFQSEPPIVINTNKCELWFAQNGMFEARPHNHKSYIRHCLNVDYDPNATCPIYDRTVREIFSKCDDPIAMLHFWDEVMGYTLQPRRPRPIIVIGRGGGSNGKTSLVQLLVKMLGHQRVAAMPIQDIDKDRFAVGALDGKLLLIDDDVKAGTRLPDGQLKRLSEAKIVQGEHKFGAKFSFTIRTVPVLLCNNSPSIADLSHGLRRRLCVVPFDRTFSDADIDVHVFQTIAATEMAGVLNRWIYGLVRVLQANWEIRKPRDVAAATEQFIAGANPLADFLASECVGTGSILVRRLFEIFQKWCEASKIMFRKQRAHFTADLRGLGYNITHSNKGDIVVGLSCRKCN